LLGTILIPIPAWGNVNLIEMVWSISGALLILFTLIHLPELRRDRLAANASGKPALQMIAWSWYRREIVRFLIGCCILSIGIYSAVQPPLPVVGNHTTVTGLVITAVLLSIGVLSTVQSAWDWRTRRELIHLLRSDGMEDS
jgi:hypothetical protein